MKIGVFGGTFNPPHIGHLIGAEKARDTFGLEKVIFVPVNIPSHKEKPFVSAQDRLNMTAIAIQDNPYFEVTNIEVKRDGISYTIDTLKQLKEFYPKTKFYLIIGTDEAKDFKNWKEPASITSLCEVIVLPRSKDRYTVQISSTEIRKMIKEGKSIKYLVPIGIEKYIKKRRLYK